MNDSKANEAAAEPPLDCRVGQRTKRYLNNGHEWDDDGCCVHCGFDGAEYWWWRRDTYEGRAMATEMPKCKVPNAEITGRTLAQNEARDA